MRIELTKSVVDQAMEALRNGLQKYLAIQALIPLVDVKSDREFQRKFNGFYRIKYGAEWQRNFYSLFAEVAENGSDYRSICNKLHERTGRWEASFASKMLASIDPAQPVIDSIVLKNLCLKLPRYGAANRLDGICAVHRELKEKLETILTTQCGLYIQERFAQSYPDADITPIKMLDLVLWQTRPAH